MNKHIKELLLKVVHMQGEDGEYLPSLVTEEHIEKFAELIVKECILSSPPDVKSEWLDVYTHPPKQWQGLSDDEYIDMIIKANTPMKSTPDMAVEFGRLLEAKLKEKNG